MPLPVVTNSDSDNIDTINYPFHDRGVELPPFPIFGPINMENLIFIGALILLIIAIIEKRQ